VKVDRLTRVRDTLPGHLNAGILLGDGGFCVLGWMMMCAGFHEITFYSSTIAVLHPQHGGSVVDVIAREYDLERDEVVRLARVNDDTPATERSDAVRAVLDELIAAGGEDQRRKNPAAPEPGSERPGAKRREREA